MLKPRDRELMHHERDLIAGKTGAHFCPDWDFMAICDGMPEMEACTCDLAKIRADDVRAGRKR